MFATESPEAEGKAPVMLRILACGCWFNFRAQRSHRCERHQHVQADFILRGGVAAD